MCLLTHERYKTYQMGFHLAAWVMPQGWDLVVPRGVGGRQFFFMKFNQIWCVSYLHEWHMYWCHFSGSRPLGPRGGAKRSNVIKSELQSQFQSFSNQTLCIFSQMKDINISDGIFFRPPGSCPGVGLGGTVGGWGVKKSFFRNSIRFGV